MKCPSNCNEIRVLHATPRERIPNIIEKGFEYSKFHPERISHGRGSGEENIFFFERYNKDGAKNILQWMPSLSRSKETDGIVEAKVCSCNYLDKRTLQRENDAIFEKSIKFIAKTLNEEDNIKWLAEHEGGGPYGLKTYYKDPFSYMRKVAVESARVIYDKDNKIIDVIRPDIGDVMNELGYDAADGYTGSHMGQESTMNELITTDPKRIYNIREVKVEDLCHEFSSDKEMAALCKNRLRRKKG